MKTSLKRIKDFFNSIDWMFQVNNYSKEFQCSKNDEEGKLAEITIDVKYQDILVKLFPRFFTYDLEAQRKTLLHELCHIIVAPEKLALHDLLEGKLITEHRIHQINEESTSKIENILNQLLAGRLKYARVAYAEYVKKPKKKKRRKHA